MDNQGPKIYIRKAGAFNPRINVNEKHWLIDEVDKAYFVALNALLVSGLCGQLLCHTDAECQLRGIDSICVCKIGYSGDGMNCTSGDISKSYLANLYIYNSTSAFSVQVIDVEWRDFIQRG